MRGTECAQFMYHSVCMCVCVVCSCRYVWSNQQGPRASWLCGLVREWHLPSAQKSCTAVVAYEIEHMFACVCVCKCMCEHKDVIYTHRICAYACCACACVCIIRMWYTRTVFAASHSLLQPQSLDTAMAINRPMVTVPNNAIALYLYADTYTHAHTFSYICTRTRTRTHVY